ncbi:PRC-barrel domain-containing protein [Roseobacter sp.]|uniref:PRC-barrel domain-containing protein n=1 Tax=Roseobacter sp. TaxID=1907202 RepID=UPI0025D2C3C7|nr:PRC-barrel domain-containing protein [Roseobacter sp.]
MSHSKLMTTVAVLALTAGTAFAGSTETKAADEELKIQTQTEAALENAEQEIEETASDAAAATENAAEATAEATGDAAQAVEETAENAAEATEEAIEDTAAATESVADEAVEETAEAAEETEQAIEQTADAATTEDTDMASEDTVTSAATGSEFSGMVVGDLLGLNVYEANGDDIGEIDYIVRGANGYEAVIGIGGFLGLGEYTVAIPLEEFSMSAEDDGLKLSTWTEEELEAQPEFDETGVEGLADDVRLDEMS